MTRDRPVSQRFEVPKTVEVRTEKIIVTEAGLRFELVSIERVPTAELDERFPVERD